MRSRTETHEGMDCGDASLKIPFILIFGGSYRGAGGDALLFDFLLVSLLWVKHFCFMEVCQPHRYAESFICQIFSSSSRF